MTPTVYVVSQNTVKKHFDVNKYLSLIPALAYGLIPSTDPIPAR